MVEVSDWGLQKTLGSDRSRFSSWEATSRVPTRAVGLGLIAHRYLLVYIHSYLFSFLLNFPVRSFSSLVATSARCDTSE